MKENTKSIKNIKDTDHLKECIIDVGSNQLSIVCGAPNITEEILDLALRQDEPRQFIKGKNWSLVNQTFLHEKLQSSYHNTNLS